MNRIKAILILVFLQWSFLLVSCEKPNSPDLPAENYPTNLEVLWNAIFHSDRAGDYFWDYEIANGQYIVLANTNGRKNDKPRGIGIYNMQTGKRHPAWLNDPGSIFSATEFEDLSDCKIAGVNKDIILIYSAKELFGYSLHTGQRMWKLNIPNNRVKMSAAVDHAFVTYGANGGLSKSWYRLALVDVYSGKKVDILQLEIEDNYEFAINPPSAYVIGGDTLLFFTTGAWNFDRGHGRVHAYCFNMTKKQMVWANKEFTMDTDATAFQLPPFVIENDKLIVTSMRAIHCFNRHTGKLVWQKEGLGFADRPPLYHKEKIYIRYGDPGALLCLDAQSGQTVWLNTAIDCIPAPNGKMDIYKDRLYFSAWGPNATHHLACVDIHTGKELWTDRGPYDNIAFGVLIDQKTGYLYCNTGWSLMCVDLNKTPNGGRNKNSD